MEDIYKIYRLINPVTQEIRYIGVTKRKLRERMYHHIYTSKYKRGTRVSKWIYSLLKSDIIPIIELVEECNKTNWEEREIYWIDFYRKNGYNLTNLQKGGSGIVINRTKDSIQRSSEAHNRGILQIALDKDCIIKEWQSITEAANYFGVVMSGIAKAASRNNNNQVVASGYRWIFAEDFNNGIKPKKLLLNSLRHLHKKVYQYDSDRKFIRVFNSSTEAYKSLSVKNNEIARSIRNGYKSGGYYWSYYKYEYLPINTNL